MVENGDILATNSGDVRTFIMVVGPTTLFRRLHIVCRCEAVRRVLVCPWDDEGGMQRKMIGLTRQTNLEGKRLRNATIVVLRRQKPLTNALDGLYMPCVDRMLEARCLEGCDESLLRCTYMCLMEKSQRASLHPRWCRFSPHGEVSLPGEDNSQSLTLCSPDHFTMGRFTCLL